MTPSPSACSAWASARPCSAGRWNSPGCRGRAPPSPSRSRRRPRARAATVPMKILIADDHAVVRQGLKQILADEYRRAVFGEAGTAQEAIDRIWSEDWDAV